MKLFNAILTAGIVTASAGALFAPSAVAGTSCNKIGDTTFCSGTVNGEYVETSSYTMGDTVYTSGVRGSEVFTEMCYTMGSSTFCS